MARLFSVNVFAAAVIAMRCSGSAAIAIAGSGIATPPVEYALVGSSYEVRITVTSRAQKGARTIATASASIGYGRRGRLA